MAEARARGRACEVENVEEDRQQSESEHPVRCQTREEIAEYQAAMIRQEAHEIWLIRRVNNQYGDEESDWAEAERHYFCNN